MPIPSDLRFVLRNGTRAAHERLDAGLNRFHLGDIADYRAFLVWHAGLVPAIEDHLTRAGMKRLLADWPQRRRTAALLSDLRALGVTRPPMCAVDLPAGDAALAGCAYVLEGSRLGGTMLMKRVDPALKGTATAYLEHGTGEKLWPGFVETINKLAFSEAETRAAVDAAGHTFALFEAALCKFQPEGETRAAS